MTTTDQRPSVWIDGIRIGIGGDDVGLGRDGSPSRPNHLRFMLDLAVRGQLVEQYLNDEPAVELLKRISEDIFMRQSRSDYSAPKSHIEIAEGDRPFVVPVGWEWGRQIEVTDVSDVFAFESERFNDTRVGMPFIAIRDISSTDTQAYADGDFDPFYIVRKGNYRYWRRMV